MKKVIRLTEKDVERMVKKILKEDWKKGGDEDYMEDIDFEDLERKLSRHLDYSKKEVGKGVHYVDDPESFDYGKQLTGPKNLWWGYKHTSGTYQAKRYFSSLDIVEAEDSPFCEMVVGPFEANDRDDALRQVRELTN